MAKDCCCLNMKAKEKGEPQAMDVTSVIAASINRLFGQTSSNPQDIEIPKEIEPCFQDGIDDIYIFLSNFRVSNFSFFFVVVV